MHLLIITSEVLNSTDILPSTFELSQAQILSREHKARILSVQVHTDLFSRFKLIVKKLIGRATQAEGISTIISDCLKTIALTFNQKYQAEVHKIEGIKVYEAHARPLKHQATFKKALDLWVEAGMYAFKKYADENGLPDLVHAHGRFLNAGVLAREIQKKYGCYYVYTEHCTWYQSSIAPRESIPFLKEVIHHAGAFTAVSSSLVKYVSKFIGEDLPQSVVIPNVMDKIFQEPLSLNKHEKFIFINIASLDEKKGIDILIKAFSRSFKNDQNCVLYICGDGMLRLELEQLSTAEGIKEQIIFFGKKSKSEIRQLLDGADVFVLPSRIETFGVVVIEALSRGLPVIATICGGPEFIVDTCCGVLIEADNVEALSQEMVKMRADYKSYNHNDIHQYAIGKYGAETFLKHMNHLYQSVLS